MHVLVAPRGDVRAPGDLNGHFALARNFIDRLLVVGVQVLSGAERNNAHLGLQHQLVALEEAKHFESKQQEHVAVRLTGTYPFSVSRSSVKRMKLVKPQSGSPRSKKCSQPATRTDKNKRKQEKTATKTYGECDSFACPSG